MKKEVVAKEAQQLSLFDASMVDDVFSDMELDASDIVIPKLLLMQPMSDLVTGDKASIGDFTNSVTGKKVGSIVDPIEIVPFYSKKSWDIQEDGDGNKWIRNEEYNLQNANLPWQDVENGKKIKRIKRLDFYCLVPKLMAEGSVLPVVLSFKSTGYRGGGIIITEWHEIKARNANAKQAGRLNDLKLPFSKSFVLSGKKLTNDQRQTYCVPSVEVGKEVDAETQKLALQWLNTIKTSKNVVVDESDSVETTDEHTDIADGTGAF